MKDTLQNEQKFKDFRALSGQFLNGTINEQVYYTR